MKARRLFALSILAIAFGCDGNKVPTALRAPHKTSSILSDGAHGGNHDFFFLQPLVADPSASIDFEAGKSNNTLQSALVVQICELKPEIVTGKPAQNPGKLTVPTATTACIPGAPLKKFGAGSVRLVTDLSAPGFWTGLNLPADGFYYALWDTGKIDLKEKKFYRIMVFVDGSSDLLGYVDVATTENQKKWGNLNTGGVIQIVDDAVLPIPFRVEQGALCGDATSCTSTVVTNNDPSGSQTVTVDGGLSEAIAGARFPNGWLPAGGPQSVVVTISSVNTGESNQQAGTQQFPCHAKLPLQQFDGCFKFTTTPTLAFIGHTTAQFAKSVTVAVCYVLEGTTDPRRDFAQMYASGPNEAPHALTDVSDEGILSPLTRSCTPTGQIGSTSPVMHLASSAWRNLKGGLGQLFSVKTAYAVDVGLGGLLDAFSNVGAALPATIEAYPNSGVALVSGVATVSARIVGNHQHSGEKAVNGINTIPVTFTVAPDNGHLGIGEGQTPQQTVSTSPAEISNGDVSISVDGIASVIWTPPSSPGTYHMTASGPTTNGSVTFTVVVPPPPVIGLAPPNSGLHSVLASTLFLAEETRRVIAR